MSDPTDSDTPEDSHEVEDAEVDKVVDDEQFEKDFEENKQEISLLLNVFDTRSYLMKALAAVELWTHILDSKCAVQKILRPLKPILRQMEKHKKLDSPLPNPRNLTPEDTRQFRKLWEKGDVMPVPKGLEELTPEGLEALTSIKERLKYESFRDTYLVSGRRMYYHFQMLNPTMESNVLKDELIKEFGKCESKGQLEKAFSEYEKKRRNVLELTNGNSKEGDNTGTGHTNGNSDDESTATTPEVAATATTNVPTPASSPNNRYDLRKRVPTALACVSPSPSKKRKTSPFTAKKGKTKKEAMNSIPLLWELTAQGSGPQPIEEGQATNKKWLEVAHSMVYVVFPFFESILDLLESTGETSFGVSKKYQDVTKKRNKVGKNHVEKAFQEEKKKIVWKKLTWDRFCELQTTIFTKLTNEEFHLTDGVISSLIAIGMVDAETITEKDTIKSLCSWIPERSVRTRLYGHLEKIEILIETGKTSEFITAADQESSIERKLVVTTIKRIESKLNV